MENHIPADAESHPACEPVEAHLLLGALDADRTALARRAQAPGWFYPALGLCAAGYVGSAVIGSDGPRRVVVWVVLVAMMLVLYARQRRSGVRFAPTGAAGVRLFAAVVIPVLVLLSIALGLAASLSNWWVLLPAAATYAVVVLVGRRFERLHRNVLDDTTDRRAR